MAERIIHQGPGFTIAATDELGTMTHYPRIERHDGNINHGFVDLRDRPDLVDSIPEASKSPAIARLLRLINALDSPLMSIGCECSEFELPEARPTGERFQVGGYIDLTHRDPRRNQSESALVDVAAAILRQIPAPPDGIVIGYEMIVAPLKLFFGALGHFGLMVKPLGYGKTSTEAWLAFDHATSSIETSLRALLTAGK